MYTWYTHILYIIDDVLSHDSLVMEVTKPYSVVYKLMLKVCADHTFLRDKVNSMYVLYV